jgi:hypothetical protein
MKKIATTLIIIALTISAYSKNNRRGSLSDAEGAGHDIGVSIGPAWALTDLGGAKKIGSPFLRDIDFPATRFGISVFYRYNINKIFAVRANLMYGMLKADDKDTDGNPPGSPGGVTDSWYRARRNLNFTTHIFEFQALVELNLKKYQHDVFGKGEKERWAPYVAAGLGFFYFNPYTKVGGTKVKLKPLGTEGQNLGGIYGKPYSNFQFDLMAVVGVKFNVTKRLSIAVEGVYHQTFTDYLDDVSGNYVNADDVALVSPLQNRANELTGPYSSPAFNFVEGQFKTDGTPNSGAIGQQRGDKKDNDQFLNLNVVFSISLGGGGSRGAFGSCGRKNPYHHKFYCPKW